MGWLMGILIAVLICVICLRLKIDNGLEDDNE